MKFLVGGKIDVAPRRSYRNRPHCLRRAYVIQFELWPSEAGLAAMTDDDAREYEAQVGEAQRMADN